MDVIEKVLNFGPAFMESAEKHPAGAVVLVVVISLLVALVAVVAAFKK